MKNLIILLILGIASCTLANGCPEEQCLLETTAWKTAFEGVKAAGGEQINNLITEFSHEDHPCSEFAESMDKLDKSCPFAFWKSAFEAAFAYALEDEQFQKCWEGFKELIQEPFWYWNPATWGDVWSYSHKCIESFKEHEKTKKAGACMHEMVKHAHGMKEHMKEFPEMIKKMAGETNSDCKGSIEESCKKSIEVFTTRRWEPTEACQQCGEDFKDHMVGVFEESRSFWTC